MIRVRLCLVVGIAALLAAPSASASPNTYSLTAQPASAAVGQAVALTATATPGSSGQTVTFFNPNGGPISGCSSMQLTSTGSAYAATCHTSFSTAGVQHLQAFFYYLSSPSGGASLDYTVTAAGTSVSLASSVPNPVVSEPFTLTATVAGSLHFTGTVAFTDNGAAISGCGSQPVYERQPGQPPWFATCQVSFAAPGSHSFVASYSGDSSNGPGTSAPLALTVGSVGGGQLPVCQGQDQVVSRQTLSAARQAVICLLDEIRARYGEPALVIPAGLEAYAQSHPYARVPATFLHRAGGATTLADGRGDRTPYDFVASVMRSREGCTDVLSENEAGVGVVPQALVQHPPPRGGVAFAEGPTWTLLLVATTSSANPGAAAACPHPLQVDAAGHGRAPKPHSAASDLALLGLRRSGGSLELAFSAQSRRAVTATLVFAVGHLNLGRLTVAHVRRGPVHTRRLALGRAGRSALHAGVIVTVTVHERSPAHLTYLFEFRL